MKVEFLGLSELSKRQDHRDFALHLVTETDFEQSFLGALLDSGRGRTCHPKASLLVLDGGKISIMIVREDEPLEDESSEEEQKPISTSAGFSTISDKSNDS